MDQRAKAERLRALHVPGEPLVLLNAWDAGSAAVIAKAGAQAIATTSAGAANALGYPDGQLVTREQMLSMVAPIAAAVDLPVTADMEAGYGDSPEDAAATARGLVEVGGVGLNLEDTAEAGDDPLLSIDAFVAKIAAVKAAGDAAGVPLVLNARTDVFIGQVGDPATRLERAVERGRAYLDAGADCIFVPAVADAGTIGALVEGIGGPRQHPRRPRLPHALRARRARRRPRQRRLRRLPGCARACAPDGGGGVRRRPARRDDSGAGLVRRSTDAVRALTQDRRQAPVT